jgi:hypothetical protein
MDEIINKVATSKLEVFDLEDHYPKGVRSQVDISQWLLEGFLLKEKSLGNTGLSTRQFVAVNCSTDAIVPCGFHISYNPTFATKIVDGNIDDLNAALYEELLAKIDFSAYVNKSIIIKAVRKAGSYTCLCSGRTIFTTLCPYYVRRSLLAFRYTKQK